MVRSIRLDRRNREFFRAYMPPNIYPRLDDSAVLGIGAVGDETAMGALVVEVRRPTVNILWLYVAEAKRRQGVASMLLTDLERAATTDGIKEICAPFSELDDIQTVTALLKARGYELCRLDGSGLLTTRLSNIHLDVLGNVMSEENVILWPDVPEPYLRCYGDSLAKRKVETPGLPLKKNDYLECSSAVSQNGRLTGACLFKRLGAAHVQLCYLAGEARSVAEMLALSFMQMGTLFPLETAVTVVNIDGKFSRLFHRLSSGSSVSEACIGKKTL